MLSSKGIDAINRAFDNAFDAQSARHSTALLAKDLEIERLRGELRKIRDCKTLEEAQDIARLARTQPNTEAQRAAAGGPTGAQSCAP